MQVFYALDDVMSDDAIIVADGGDFVATAAYILRFVGDYERLW